MKLNTSINNHVEQEVVNYDSRKALIHELRSNLLYGGGTDYSSAPPSGFESGGKTENKGIQLADWGFLRELHRITKAIEEAYLEQNTLSREIIWVAYGLSMNGWEPDGDLKERMSGRNRCDMELVAIADIAQVSTRTFKRGKSAFIRCIAQRLYWVRGQLDDQEETG